MWQRYSAPELFYIRVCGTPCPRFGVPLAEIDPRGAVSWWERWTWQEPGWAPLGMIPLALDGGHGTSGRYRYGDLTVVVPLGNPGLAADREHLLAIRDALSGAATLNWSASSPTREWEGVTVAGTPPRVTGLNLSNRGLDGEVRGWLGDLTELRVLRLDGNRLTGTIPSKLGARANLTDVYLAGNELDGCVPPSLRWTTHHDLDQLDLPDCVPPTLLTNRWGEALGPHDHLDSRAIGGSFRWQTDALGPSVVFDLPPGMEVRVVTFAPPYEDDAEGGYCPPCHESIFESVLGGLMVALASDDDPVGRPSVWLLLDLDTGHELERSHYVEEAPINSAILDEIAASVWVNAAVQWQDTQWGYRDHWVWPRAGMPTATPTRLATPSPAVPAAPATAAAPTTAPAPIPPVGAVRGFGEETVVELRVWQHVDDATDIWVSARSEGRRWGALGTVPFPLDLEGDSRVRRGFHLYRDLVVAEGVELRVWQRYSAPELIYVRVCGTPCIGSGDRYTEIDPRGPIDWWERRPWQKPFWPPLGMIPLPLDDGYSPDGNYRYGDLSVVAPLGNPGLAADREHLLALRDALAGTATLNWSAGSPTREWDGVTVSGTPPRVTGLDLSNRGLDGEVWGWLGNLTELTALRLDGNRLTGGVPSKLGALTKLTQVYLAGNELEGCVPPRLRSAPQHDLDQTSLPDCAPPTPLAGSASSVGGRLRVDDGLDIRAAGGSYQWRGLGPSVVVDLPPGLEMQIRTFPPHYESDGSLEGPCPPCDESIFESSLGGLLVALASDDEPPGRPTVWLLLDLLTADELQRSHYREEDPISFAILEQIAASVWVDTEAQFR
ncbi:MAG: hypothetical protein F4X25_01250 [Chloroflexi bacterium]|nr:hypothetical protein [Chloroflexota bacterium]